MLNFIPVSFCFFFVNFRVRVSYRVRVRVECWNIHSQDYSFPGTFVPMMELSFLGPFVPWNIHSLDRSFPETFVPWTVRSLDHSFPRPNLKRKIPSLDYDRSNTSFSVYVK